MKQIFSIILCVAFYSGTSQWDAHILSDEEEIRINDEIVYFKSEGESIEDILAGDHPDFKLYTGLQDLVEPRAEYWFGVALKNGSSIRQEWKLYVGRNDIIDVYVFYSDSTVRSFKAGYIRKASEKAVKKGGYFVPMPVSYGEEVSVFIKIQETLHDNPELDLRLLSENEYWARMTNSQTFNHIFFGVVLIMLLYSGVVYFTSGEITNIHYALYLAALGGVYLFLTGALREIVFAESPQLTRFGMIIVPLAAGFYYLFVRSFLNIDHLIPGWKKGFKILISGNFLYALVGLVLLFTAGMFVTARAMQFLMIANCLVALVVLVRILLIKKPDTLYYALGTTCFLVTVLFDTILWDTDNSSASTIRFGLIGEVLFYSVGLGVRWKNTLREKETAQAALIEQLEINEELSRERAQELEKLVDDRTRNLMALNSELKVYDQTISHDLRGPLANVVSLTELARGKVKKQPEMLMYLDQIQEQSRRSINLIKSILSFSVTDQLRLEQSPINLNEVWQEVGTSLKDEIEKSGADFVVNELPTLTKGVRIKLYQLFYNLASNAIKYRNPKRILQVIVSSDKTDSGIILTVQDNGLGFDPKNAKKIFEMNFRDEATLSIDGEGIGLANCERIATFHGWEIWAESEIGKGSKFKVRIPKSFVNQS